MNIPGYTYGTPQVAKSPLSLQDLELLKKTLLFDEEDVKALRMSEGILKDQVDPILDVWYGFVASNPHLVYYFGNKTDGKPNSDYLASVRQRFGKWILDTAAANYDQKWLDYQSEIGLRHHRTKKNQTDQVPSVPIINLRYVLALVVPITTTLKPFLAKQGASATDVDKMHQAWVKSVLLQTILWTQPYVKEGDF